jgi:hypothetical protein
LPLARCLIELAKAIRRHCLQQTQSVCARERSDEAIQSYFREELDCFASLAMTTIARTAQMTKKTVLAIGIDPAQVDYGAFPGLTADLVSHFIEAQLMKLRALGYDVESCLIDLGETAEAIARAALKSRPLDCVVIGAGLREPPERLLLFEKVLNLVHAHAPQAAICFNTTPADTVEAVQRWVKP